MTIKIEFAPGCFDHFEGSQEELDELIAEIQRLADSGELLEQSHEVTPEDYEAMDDEEREFLERALAGPTTRNLLQ